MTTCDVAVIGWIITFITILINNELANQRETRKEIRTKLDKLNSAFDTLLDASKNYYLDDDSNIPKEIIKIHEAINYCDRLVEELSLSSDSINKGIALRPGFYIIYELVTGGDFESAKHQPGKHHTQLCKSLSIQKELLIKQAENWFSKTFQ